MFEPFSNRVPRYAMHSNQMYGDIWNRAELQMDAQEGVLVPKTICSRDAKLNVYCTFYHLHAAYCYLW